MIAVLDLLQELEEVLGIASYPTNWPMESFLRACMTHPTFRTFISGDDSGCLEDGHKLFGSNPLRSGDDIELLQEAGNEFSEEVI